MFVGLRLRPWLCDFLPANSSNIINVVSYILTLLLACMGEGIRLTTCCTGSLLRLRGFVSQLVHGYQWPGVLRISNTKSPQPDCSILHTHLLVYECSLRTSCRSLNPSFPYRRRPESRPLPYPKPCGLLSKSEGSPHSHSAPSNPPSDPPSTLPYHLAHRCP